ncbi:MAG: glutathione transferase GstA, partial [Acidithiobacillus sp.]
MKLYYSPGACSLSPHIILNEGGFSFDKERVDLASKKTETGADYVAINPDGYVPALLLDDGQVLTEGPAIIQYLADRVPEKKLAPPLGTLERYRLMQWLNFISTELHKGFSPLFNPQAPEEWKAVAAAQLGRRLSTVSRQLEGKDWLLGEGFSVADAYLF